MTMPFISVIVPIYNTELYLKRCIDSIIQQTYTNLEIILINDGSPDTCGEICEEYKQKDNRIIVIHQENQGLSGARNSGVKIATGDYISFVDSDDYLDTTAYEKIICFILENNLDIVCFGYYNVFSNEITETSPPNIKFFTGKEALIASLKFEMTDMACNKVCKANIVKKFPFPLGKIHEDSATIYKYCSLANKVGLLNVPFYYYYQNNPDSIIAKAYKSKTLNFKARYDRFFANKERYLYAVENNLDEAIEKCYLFAIEDAISATNAIYSADIAIDDNDIKIYNLEIFLKTAYNSSIYNKLNSKNKLRIYSFLKYKNLHKTLALISIYIKILKFNIRTILSKTFLLFNKGERK